MADSTFSALVSATGTANQIDVTPGVNPVSSISNNPVLPGNAGVKLPSGTTAQRAGASGTIRFNTTTNTFESSVDGAAWQTFSSATGAISSVTGTANRISVTAGANPVVNIDAAYVGQASITTLGTITSGIWNGTALTLADGGSGGALVASNGGIIWSNAAQMQVLAGTATARQMLQSGATATPAWSTTIWPATSTINRLLYSSANNIISELASANSAVLVTSNAGVPTLSAMTNGQLIIGNTGATPTATTLTAGSDILITNGPGSIAIAKTGSSLKSFQILNAGIGATYTTPAGINGILVECVGGGGAGGGAISTVGVTTSSGAGGGAGEYCRKLFTPVAPTYNYNIGTSGSAGAVGNNPGGDGGDTIFGTVIAKGGSGGSGGAEATSSHLSGVPGSGGTGGSGADINITGAEGSYGFTSLIAYAISGAGGNSLLGMGAPGVASTNAGIAGLSANANTGAGGSGGVVANAATSVSGGAGGSGKIIVWEFS